MELDQTVLRQSFRHYGIQPKFEDERVHWWFGDAAKSLTMLPPDEYFGTFDLVLIDLVCEIFDGLRVGDQNERLVDYMMKLLKPEGILVRQEDWPEHNVVDFAKYTVDLNVFGMPHTCSQFFTMGSNAVDFANRDRVDHELEGLVWYEPNIESNNHTLIWSNYRNNLDPPSRICLNNVEGEGRPVVGTETNKNQTKEARVPPPTVGIFAAIEAENASLDDITLVQTTVKKVLEEIGFTDIALHKVSLGGSTTNSFVFSFEEGYLAMRTFSEYKYCSMDLQLWNTIANQKQAEAKLVEAVGGTIGADATSSFLVTTGGMFGIRNENKVTSEIVPSSWCQDNYSNIMAGAKAPVESGWDIVVKTMLTNFVSGSADSVVLVMCPNKQTSSSACKALDDIDYGTAQIIPLYSCEGIEEGSDYSSLAECERQLVEKIRNALFTSTSSLQAIIIDDEVPRELGQIANAIFVGDRSSYQWLSHDFVVLVPSITTSIEGEYASSWKYQLLERFRTDMVEFNPVYHATVAFSSGSDDDLSSNSYTWNIGVLQAGNPRFYSQLIESLNEIREVPAPGFRKASLVETKTGVMSHIPDYQPSKWATPSDYDIGPATQQWFNQHPLGQQLIVQYEKLPTLPDDISVGTKVLIEREKDWCLVSCLQITSLQK